MMVIALEASPDVPKMEVVTERLLHEERKRSELIVLKSEKAMTMRVKHSSHKKKGPCHHCGKMGHFKNDCWTLSQ